MFWFGATFAAEEDRWRSSHHSLIFYEPIYEVQRFSVRLTRELDGICGIEDSDLRV